ncbi:hypothetical protein XNC3_2420023 [Xenorhabdus nematophila F1]|nr:hypothetical protein XNC3_2420023 [Xenorhabdus nematophila F1]
MVTFSSTFNFGRVFLLFIETFNCRKDESFHDSKGTLFVGVLSNSLSTNQLEISALSSLAKSISTATSEGSIAVLYLDSIKSIVLD